MKYIQKTIFKTILMKSKIHNNLIHHLIFVSYEIHSQKRVKIFYEIRILDDSRYCIEGIAIPSIGSIGLIGNLIVVGVLFCLIRNNSEQGSQRNFDVTLMSLAIIDFILLIMYITDSYIQNHFDPINVEQSKEPLWYKVKTIYVLFIKYI